ncbi:MAG: Plug domain-containing protein, partial [Bacteroidales bacterium]|nr:Plug domain-containing protein [Bacteroidales bacterium]
MMKFYTFLLVICLYPAYLFAQNEPDTTSRTYDLKTVDINASRLQFAPEVNIQKFDQELLQSRSSQGIQTLLSDYANVNIRSYGYGGLSNVSMRGANSNHTAVLWNGFNLQDPMNGGTNMLLFPLFFVDQVQVQKGGSSALFGSGAMGGVISLENNLAFNKGLQLGLFTSVGSFANYQTGASVNISGKKAIFRIKAFYKE